MMYVSGVKCLMYVIAKYLGRAAADIQTLRLDVYKDKVKVNNPLECL